MQYFYVDVYLGSQKQRQSLIVDTGSGITALPCLGHCASCGTNHLNDYFDINASLTKQVLDCHKT
jgi:hypothetical protein